MKTMTTAGKIIVGASTSVIAALVVAGFMYVPDIIAHEHTAAHSDDEERIKHVQMIAESNAEFINGQILERLYERADSLRKAVEMHPEDDGARAALRRAELEIKKREAAFSQSN